MVILRLQNQPHETARTARVEGVNGAQGRGAGHAHLLHRDSCTADRVANRARILAGGGWGVEGVKGPQWT